MHEFAEGDIVVLKTGEAPQVVLALGRYYGMPSLRTRYVSDRDDSYDTSRTWRAASDFKPYKGGKTATETKMADLYQTKTGEVEFGTLLARNSLGRLVLEMKGTGQVRDFDPSELEIVRPYTVRVVESSTGRTVNKTAIKGSVQVGDIILSKGSFETVEAIDTKSNSPKGSLSGRKVVTEALVEVAAEEGEGE